MTLPAKVPAYRNRFVELLIQENKINCELPLNSQFYFPDLETEQTLILKINQIDFTRMFSAVSYGADFAYPSEAIEICAQFLTVVSCMASICDEVENCINTDGGVRGAITTLIGENGGSSGGGTPDTVAPDVEDQLLPVGYTCDNDHLFGMCMEVVGMIHANTQQLIDIIQASAGQWLDLVNSILDNIPVLELLGLVTEAITWFESSVIADYEAAWSLTVQQEIACELFCLIKDDCILTFDDIFTVYKNESGVNAPAENIYEAWWDAVLATIFTTDREKVTGVDMVGLLAMRYGGQFAEWAAGIRTMKTTIALAQNATDSDWSILCACATPLWCYSLDLTAFAVYDFSGTPGTQNMGTLNGSQWNSSDNTGGLAGQGYMRGVAIAYQFGFSANIEKIEIDYSATQGATSGGAVINPARGMLYDGAALVKDTQPQEIPNWGSTLTASWSFTSVSANELRLWQNTDNLAANNRIGSGNITAVRLYGSGGNPFGADNC